MPKIYVAGHRGMVGSALLRGLQGGHDATILTRARDELDLGDQAAVFRFFEEESPDIVFLTAAKVGGIVANNTSRWNFIYENLLIGANVIGAAVRQKTPRVIFFGSSCIYPRLAPQPIPESALLSGPLEPTNEPYAIAKIAGLKLIETANSQFGFTWLSLMPTNLYGPGDNFDYETSHVIPGMIRKFHDAKMQQSDSVCLWGDGSPYREFLHVDDLARAAIELSESEMSGLLNVGYGGDIQIRELAETIRTVVGYEGRIEWDSSRPNGTPKKLLDSSAVRAFGWAPRIPFVDGLRTTYDWFLDNIA